MRLVVIGGIAAGLSAASSARRADPSIDITVLEKGEVISYSACGLPYYVEGRVRDWRGLQVYTPEFFRAQRRIEVRTSAEALEINHARRRVLLARGESVTYDKLVIATGASPRPGLPGSDQPHVYSMNTLEAARRLRSALESRPPGRAAVIGAGYIGLEAVEALRTYGWRVTLVDANTDLLGREDTELTARLSAHLARFGVQLALGERVASIEPDRVGPIPCDIVVAAAGMRPNVTLASDAGVRSGSTGAIETTDRMETNLHGVYAAGDCAEVQHLVTGRPTWIPLGTTANKTGRVAGAVAAGRRDRFPGIVGTMIVRVCGLGVAFTGLSERQARREGFDPVSTRVEARDKPGYFGGRPAWITLTADRRSGRLLGAAVLGEDGVAGRINVAATALTARMDLDQFAMLDLAYAPPFAPVWDPLLTAARQLRKLI
jgi:NADPH-dependent 2,4-dienoyl-CoA reductase/sulfur reductase-like enzyme